MDGFFHSAMQGFSGRNRLDSEDPRWSHLLQASGSLRALRGDEQELTAFMLRLVRHNPSTGNLLLLIEHTVSRLRQVRATKKKPPLISISQCCMALRLSRFVFNFLFAHLPPSEIRRQLRLSLTWPLNLPYFSPELTQHYASIITDGDTIVHSLLQELLQLCCQNPLPDWNTEVLFETLNLLITLCSTKLYDTINNPSTSSFAEGEANLFMEYIFLEVVRLHTDRSVRGLTDLEITASRIVGSLLTILVARPRPDSDTSSFDVLNKFAARTHTLPETPRAKHTHLSPVSNIVAAIPSVGELRILPQTLWNGIAMASTVLSLHFSWDRIYLFIVSTAARARLNISNTSSILPTYTQTQPHALSSVQPNSNECTNSPEVTLSRSSSDSVRGFSLNTNPSSRSDPNPISSARQVYGRVSDSPLAQRSALFVLILLHSKRDTHSHNPFREAMCNITDDQQTQTHTGQSLSATVVTQVPTLLQSLAAEVDLESHSLLLYTTLQCNPAFVNHMAIRESRFMLTYTETPPLLSILKCLYEAPLRVNRGLAGGPKHVYTLMILVLMCTHDETNVQKAFRQSKLKHIFWYREKLLREVSIGSVCVLCVLRTLTHALHTVHDGYLILNTLAVLQNLGPHVEFLHPYAAQRMVSVCWKLARRLASMLACICPASSLKEIGKKANNAAAPESIGRDSCENAELKDRDRVASAEIQPFAEALQTVCLVLSRSLSPNKMLGNAHIVYQLVQQYREVSVYLAHAEVKARCPLCETILTITELYYGLLREHNVAQALRSPDTAIGALKTYIQSHSHKMTYEVPEIVTLAYEERSEPEKYFVPYVWEVIYTHTPDIGWHTQHIRMFDALADSLVEDDGDVGGADNSLNDMRV